MSAPPPPPPDVDEVARIFFAAMHAMMRRTSGAEIVVMNESGLTIPQIVALHVLRDRGPVTVGDVADCTKLSRAATSHLVERLVCLGLAHRAEDAEDRRQKQVTISPAGAAMVERIMQARLESLTRAMSLLRPETLQKIASAMVAVVSDMAAQNEPGETR